MPTPSKPEIFKILNATRQKPDNQLPLFPDAHPNNTCNEYWLYSDLHNLYGEIYFPTQPSFSAHIWQNLAMPTPKKTTRAFPNLRATDINFYNNHVTLITHPYTLGNHHFKNAKDFKLSRYACWCMSRQNPYMIFARTYFIAPVIKQDIDFNELNNHCYQFARVNLRAQLAKSEKAINAILYKNNCDHHDFKIKMSIALFGDTPGAVLDKNGLNAFQKPISDYMGAATLYERNNALRNTITTINHTPEITPTQIFDIAYNEMHNAQKRLTQNLHIAPINDIQKHSVHNVQSHLTRTEHAFINKYAFEKLR